MWWMAALLALIVFVSIAFALRIERPPPQVLPAPGPPSQVLPARPPGEQPARRR
jgi:hypothetical protein